MTVQLQPAGTLELAREATIQLIGMAIAAAGVATIGAIIYRRETTRPVATGMGTFFGFSTVAAWLLVEMMVSESLVGTIPHTQRGSAIYAVAGLSLGMLLGTGGRHLGDRIACTLYGIERLDGAGDVAEVLRSARVLTPVMIPGNVSDADGYKPASEETKRALAETTFRFPNRLSTVDLSDRLETRIATDYDVDHASVRFDGGEIESVSVGKRRSGLGPSLPPGTVAVGIRADPPGDASPGDPVEIWSANVDANQLLARGRFRSSTEDLATVIVEQDEADAFDPDTRYRLVIPSEPPSDSYRLAALLRTSEQTTVAVTLEDNDGLVGEFVGWLPGTVLAIERADGVVPLPDDRVTLRPDDIVFLVGHPTTFGQADALRDRNLEKGPPDDDRIDPHSTVESHTS